MEEKCAEAGRISGDLSFPVVYCPELHFPVYDSDMADMKNYYNVKISTVKK